MLGVIHGTDKSSSVHPAWDYLRHYERVIRRFKESPINLIEIGVLNGSSLKVWNEFLDNATIVGIDINPRCAASAGGRVKVEIGSVEDPSFLQRVTAQYPPSVVIDDGSHLPEHIVYTFEKLFPALLPGGVYIVEDTEFQFGDHAETWKGDRSVSLKAYFLDLAASRMAYRMAENPSGWDRRYIVQNLDSVEFVGGAVILTKKDRRNHENALSFADGYLRRSNPGLDQRLRLVQYMIKHEIEPSRIEDMLRAILEHAAANPDAMWLLSIVLDRMNRLDEAADLALECVAIEPHKQHHWQHLAYLEQRRGREDDELAALRQAAALKQDGAAQFLSRIASILQGRGDIGGALAAAEQASSVSPGDAGMKRIVDDLRSRLG
jgi:tetratricopeptide (TPR) repeat protein